MAAIGATSVHWTGSDLTKGLLVASFGEWTLRIDDSFDPGYQWVLPVHLEGARNIRVLAVWDMGNRGRGHETARRLGSCRASVQHYDEFLSGDSDLKVISGDFNNSVFWDKPTKRNKFGDFMDQLESRGFVSAYHHHHESRARSRAGRDPMVAQERRRDLPHRLHLRISARGDRSRHRGRAYRLDRAQ